MLHLLVLPVGEKFPEAVWIMVNNGFKQPGEDEPATLLGTKDEPEHELVQTAL